jgi:hypothetical protein
MNLSGIQVHGSLVESGETIKTCRRVGLCYIISGFYQDGPVGLGQYAVVTE